MGAIAGSRVKLHLGAGDKHWPGFINCDLHAEADVNTDVRKLPFESSYADEIYAIHVVEHVPRLDVNNMFMEWHRVLKPGGKVVIEVPSLKKMAQMILDGEKNISMTTLGIYGDPRDPKPGMMHAWGYTPEELIDVLLQSGFKDAEEKEPAFHVKRRDMRVEAVKP